MAHEVVTPLQKSLDAVDRIRRRVYALGWIGVVATLAMYARLAYFHRTSDNLERLLGASVAALTCLIAWIAFAIILIILKTSNRILRAVQFASKSNN
jgi:hypothetical protein